MKKYTFLKVWLAALILCGVLFSPAMDNSHAPDQFQMENAAFRSVSEGLIVPAIIIDGFAYPVIDLPTVEITAGISRKNLMRGEVIDGRIVPSVILDEVVITPNS